MHTSHTPNELQMRKNRLIFNITILLLTLFIMGYQKIHHDSMSRSVPMQRERIKLAEFEPSAGKVLVFLGQDNA